MRKELDEHLNRALETATDPALRESLLQIRQERLEEYTERYRLGDGIVWAGEKLAGRALTGALVGAMLTWCAVATMEASPAGRSDADPSQAWFGARSGMEVLEDHLTGCMYLKAGDALFPRLDTVGNHIGCYLPAEE